MAIAESCVDAVVMEMVAVYCGGLYTAKPELAARRIEAIGFQVGHQLSERYNQKQFFFSRYVQFFTQVPSPNLNQ
jgi:trafficking protein particle complex subunit 6